MSQISGRLVDDQTRCVHWNGAADVIAIRFKCCGRYYACSECHGELEPHSASRWGPDEFDERAVLCGVCRTELSINEYFASEFRCPSCSAAFNPSCALHYDRYFVID